MTTYFPLIPLLPSHPSLAQYRLCRFQVSIRWISFISCRCVGKMAATVGKWIAGNSLFIQGQPNAFSPLLAKHFILVESLLLPASAALCSSHYVSAMFTRPERKALMQAQFLEVTQRSEAIIFWSKNMSYRREEAPNFLIRFAAVTVQALMMPMWLIVAAWSPASVHQCLATATDVLQQKYVATAKGAPHDFYTPNIDRMSISKQQHASNGDTLDTDFAAALFITFFVAVHFK